MSFNIRQQSSSDYTHTDTFYGFFLIWNGSIYIASFWFFNIYISVYSSTVPGSAPTHPPPTFGFVFRMSKTPSTTTTTTFANSLFPFGATSTFTAVTSPFPRTLTNIPRKYNTLISSVYFEKYHY
jgi:hypothetical protein